MGTRKLLSRPTSVRRALVAAALASVMVVPGLATPTAATPSGVRAPGEVIELKDARIKFEINATDEDGGIQVFIDADQWRRMSIFDPAGRRIFTATTKGRMARQGGTELFMESAEPNFVELSLDELLARWPEGTYTLRGSALDGTRYLGRANVTHNIPAGPELVSPVEGAGPQDPRNTTVRWRPVGAANGSPIVGYQVLVVQPDTGIPGLPKVILDVMMPPSATSMAVPPGFLLAGTEYEWEVLAVEEGGNQTLSSSVFTTAN